MDDIKDIQKREHALRILENGLKTRPFGSNIAGERAYARAERCAAAVYLITNHIRADEPVRIAARKCALELLTHVLNLRHEMRSGGATLHDTVACIRREISIVRLLSVGGFVSMQNVEVLVEALDELANILERSQRSTLSENVVLKADDFAANTSITDIKRTDIGNSRQHMNVTSVMSSNKRTDSRGESIVSILRAKGGLGIKDISSHLPEYSEKMIQRELLRLVASGVLIKEGEKRWSTYSLAQK
jgi:hypothetical protein